MAPEVYLPLRQFAAHYHDRAAARAAVAELAAALETLPDIAPAEEPAAPAPAVPARPASLTVSALTVAVPGGPTPIRGADLVVAAGEHVAILGESGVGKSTLLEALACLREAQGTILLDGETLARLAEPELRARVALLGQRPRLFAGTIAENIRLGRPDASWTEVEAAAAAAAVDAFTDRLPARLDTVLGERGLGLSGGEVQRVALARIYLRRPSLVLLDEPTAHLDAATEALVLDGLLTFAEGRTLLVATHSAAVAARMDRVLRVAGGRLLPVRRRVAGLVSAAQPESVA
jgi:ATP-binding cassette subfamily C protein CydD